MWRDFFGFYGFLSAENHGEFYEIVLKSIVIHNILLKWFKFSPKSMDRSGGCDCQVVVFIPASACMRDVAGLNLQEGLDTGNHLADPNHPSKNNPGVGCKVAGMGFNLILCCLRMLKTWLLATVKMGPFYDWGSRWVAAWITTRDGSDFSLRRPKV